jgi:hypothetical protein
MFKYISQILSKFTQGQRILALCILLLSITFITVGPKIVSSLTYDDTELKTQLTEKANEINQLRKEVSDLNLRVQETQIECTDRVFQREQEILKMIEDLQRTAANCKVPNKTNLQKTNIIDEGSEGDERVLKMESSQRTIIQIDETLTEQNRIMNEGLKKITKKIKNGKN